jgi:hypothetical protein
LRHHVENADLLIVAVGKPGFIPGEWIKEGAIVVDVGINRLESGKVVGDVVLKMPPNARHTSRRSRRRWPDDRCYADSKHAAGVRRISRHSGGLRWRIFLWANTHTLNCAIC